MTTTKRVGAMLVLASLAFVLSSRLVTEGSTVAGREVRATAEAVDNNGATPVHPEQGEVARTTPRAILVGRGAPLTVVRDAQDVELAIVESAREWNIDAAVFLCVARAESGLRANAIGIKGERGLMQFMPTTWGYYERLPDHTARWTGNAATLGYGEQDVWLPIPAARVAASMFAHGQAGQWSTYRGCVR